MSSVPQPQLELEHWRRRVREARSVYLNASQQHKRMTEELGHSAIPFHDGSFAIAKARRAEAAALSEYHRLMAIYKNVVLGETSPLGHDEGLLL
jgi:hypothetical protein